jgi:hypothetical protein
VNLNRENSLATAAGSMKDHRRRGLRWRLKFAEKKTRRIVCAASDHFVKDGGEPPYFAVALSITALVKAPCGSLVMTGSEPPVSKVATVRL